MVDKLKSAGKMSLAAMAQARLRWKTAREAKLGLQVLERAGRTVPHAQRRRAREEAVERFGARRHAVWLMLYAAVQGRYREGWLPESYYVETARHCVNGVSHHLAQTAAATPLLFNSPAVCDLLYKLNGRFLSREHSAIGPVEALSRLRASGREVIFKADASAFGLGVRTLDTAALDEAELGRLSNGVFQPLISGHEVFDAFGSTALATLRIATVLPFTGAPEIRACYLKLGRPHQAHVIARDQIRVAVDWETGALSDTGYFSDWQPCDTPPGGTAKFGKIAVPAIAQATATALALHAQMPLPRFIAWDFAIDRNDAIHLLEWEGGVIGFAEATQGPCFLGAGFD